ncbi:MAG: NUDIX hydrolase [Cyclobacteriaceae bacterium]
MFDRLIENLRRRLVEPLPGYVAQSKMSAKPKEGGTFKRTPSKRAKLGGVAIVLYPHNGEVVMPLIVRPEYDGVHSGQISFPGGKQEAQDSDLVATAFRETEEEIGIPRDTMKMVGTLSQLYIFASDFQVLPVVVALEQRPTFYPDTTEVSAVVEVGLGHLLDPKNRKRKDLDVRGFTIDAPYFEVENKVVWGATAMMLSEFLEVIEHL